MIHKKKISLFHQKNMGTLREKSGVIQKRGYFSAISMRVNACRKEGEPLPGVSSHR